MQGFVATKLNEFEKGKISRRGLIEALTVAATTVYGGAAKAQESDPALKVALINHISLSCPDYQKTADWYSQVFNLEQTAPGEADTNLPFGRQGEKPVGVTADDVPVTFIITRTRAQDAPAANSGQVRRQARARIDHISYSVADFDAARAEAELRRLGAGNVRVDNVGTVHCTDPDGFTLQVSGIDFTAIRDN
jgi:catechol 2,3-dioxygenase-like lactoylglutathione lyase family enzyme